MNENLHPMQRRCFECWKIYGKRKSGGRRAVYRADYSYKMRLKQKAINALLQNRIDAKATEFVDPTILAESEAILQAVTEFNRKRICRQAYSTWFRYYKERRRIRGLNEKMYVHRNELFLRRFVDAWKINSTGKKEMRILENKADEFYCNYLQRKHLRLWVNWHSESIDLKNKWNYAILHNQLKLLKKVFRSWTKYCNVKIERMNKITDAQCFYEDKLLRKSIKKLATNVTRRIAKQAMLQRASYHYEQILLRRILHSWINYCRRKIDIDRKIELRLKRVENNIKEKIIWQLRLNVWRKKCNRRSNYNATKHFNRKTAKRVISVLRNYLEYRRKKLLRLNYLQNAVARISNEIIKMYISKWRVALICKSQERQQVLLVEELFSMRLLKYHLNIWKLYSRNYKKKVLHKKMLFEKGKTVLLYKYMELWLKKYEIVLKLREKGDQASLFFDNKLKRRFFNYWKRYIDQRNIQKLEIAEAKNFYRKQLLREGLRKVLKIYLYQSESRFENKLRIASSNWCEDFEILRRFFSKWWTVSNAKVNFEKRSRIMRVNNDINVHQDPRIKSLPSHFVLPEYMKGNVSNFLDNWGFCERRDVAL